jgi:hypothetical protein
MLKIKLFYHIFSFNLENFKISRMKTFFIVWDLYTRLINLCLFKHTHVTLWGFIVLG